MAEKKPHLYFRNPVEGVVKFKQKTRFPGKTEEEDEKEEKNYTPMRDDFIRSRNNFITDKNLREERRNIQLNVPAKIDVVEIHFFDFFDSTSFEGKYRQYFGLSPIKYLEFNSVVLFAVIDTAAFANFLENIRLFTETVDHSGEVTYDTSIKFIKKFFFHGTDRIKQYIDFKEHIVLNLIDNPEIFTNLILPVETSLIQYLSQKNVNFYQDLANNRIEIIITDEALVNEILNNFDVIQSANSYLSGVISPSAFNTPIRSYGFTITNATDTTLPIIGVIDTGISNQSPIANITINTNNDFDITGTTPLLDSVNHGTAVATLAALGKKLYPNHIGAFEADARLLSIKVLGDLNGSIPQAEIIRLIREANLRHGIKIFTLTITYTTPKKENSSISEYAYLLDLLSYELDVLIFISVGNNINLMINNAVVNYPNHFESAEVNLFSPSESMNNISIGAVAGNLENNDVNCISPDGNHPAIYTRKFHINWTHSSINKTRVNRHLVKPDIGNFGGDLDVRLDPSVTGIKTVSTSPGVFFSREVGTSYSTPLSANLAAKLLKQYPNLINSMQTVKALIINSADAKSVGNTFDNLVNLDTGHLLGKGIPDDDKCLFSNENSVTFVLEDTIRPEEIKAYPINIPEYLNTVDKSTALLQVDVTLCFKFKPIPNSHLTYCPIHMTFGIFRNKPLQTQDATGNNTDEGLNGNTMKNVKFKESWAQDYYYKPKLLSNAQKISFNISKKELIEESNSFKIALNAKFHKLLSANEKQSYNLEHAFSLVISIKENPIKGVNTGNLYNELVAINTMDLLTLIDLEGEAIAEAE
ncbi:MAG: S8 family peptidase [Bacteroidia bacterium]